MMLDIFTLLDVNLHEAIGIFGFLLYVASYSLLTLGKLSSGEIGYFILNTCAASCVLIGLTQSFNLASALIQCFWIVVSIIAILLRLRRRTAKAPQQLV